MEDYLMYDAQVNIDDHSGDFQSDLDVYVCVNELLYAIEE